MDWTEILFIFGLQIIKVLIDCEVKVASGRVVDARAALRPKWIAPANGPPASRAKEGE